MYRVGTALHMCLNTRQIRIPFYGFLRLPIREKRFPIRGLVSVSDSFPAISDPMKLGSQFMV